MNDMQRIVSGCLILLAVSLCPAGEKTTIALMDLKVQEGVSPEIGGTLADLMATEVGKLGLYTVLSRDDMQDLLKHLGDQQALSSDEDGDLAKVGDYLGAGQVLSGSVGRVGDTYVVSLKLVDSKQATVLKRVSQEYAGDEGGLVQVVKGLVNTMFTGEKEPPAAAPERKTIRDEAAAAAGALKIAVMDLSAKQGISSQVTASLTDLATNEIARIEKYRVINRDDIQVMLQHLANQQLLRCDDTKCLAVIGGALGVDYLFSGNIGKIGRIYVINLKVINIDQAEVLSRVTEEYAGDESGLVERMKYAIDKLFDEGRLFRQKLFRWSVLGLAGVGAGTGGYFAWAGNDGYDNKYLPAIGHDASIRYKTEVKELDLYRNVSLAATTVFSGVAWYLFKKK